MVRGFAGVTVISMSMRTVRLSSVTPGRRGVGRIHAAITSLHLSTMTDSKFDMSHAGLIDTVGTNLLRMG